MAFEQFVFYTYAPAVPNEHTINLFFAHANGVPALTYKTLFEKMVQRLNVRIISYDLRGIGKTTAKEKMHTDVWTWQHLVDDHVAIFKDLQKKYIGRWILVGHSLGAWLSLLSSEVLGMRDVWLIDAPILEPKIATAWMVAVLIGKKDITPNGKKARRRKRSYASYEEAYEKFQKKSFTRKWGKETIQNYLEGSFEQRSDHIALRHNPEWEAHLFEEYPAMAFLGFLKISFSWRKKLHPIFFVGEKSDTCHPKAKLWVRCFFPKLRWNLIPEGTHMFPLELPEVFIEHVVSILS
jgi:pimeloyl-ACP methyl ester carboxylesterase